MIRIILSLSLLMVTISAYPCSAFKYVDAGNVYVAKNFDWHTGEGYLIKNNRNTKKCTYLDYDGRNTCWTSKYGSITFNQNGKELPYGGMNEAGLVVEMLWLKETNYAENLVDASIISELEWIQYQLDNFKSVAGVIANLEKLEIDPVYATIHYFIADQSGKSAVVEYLDGQLAVNESEGNIQTITNTSNSASKSFYDRNKSKLTDVYIPQKKASTLRYCSLQNNLSKLSASKDFTEESAFELLGHVSEDKEFYKSYWNIVYDISHGEIQFKTYGQKVVNTIDLAELDFDGGHTSFKDLSTVKGGKVSWENYDAESNLALIEKVIKPTLKFDYTQLNAHQLSPEKSQIDEVFESGHMDVTVLIKSKIPSGNVRFFLADSEQNYRRQGPFGGTVTISSNETTYQLYSLPVDGKYAYGAMHDVNGNGILDRNMFKMPKEPFAFSGKKRFLFLPPKYKKATFDLTKEVVIEIK